MAVWRGHDVDNVGFRLLDALDQEESRAVSRHGQALTLSDRAWRAPHPFKQTLRCAERQLAPRASYRN